jgi:hypothetical protein
MGQARAAADSTATLGAAGVGTLVLVMFVAMGAIR